MNKYSSKAVKTAATVGMSLAMVLSAAAPVLAAADVMGTKAQVCYTAETKQAMSEAKDALNAMIQDLKSADNGKINLSKVQASTEYTWTNTATFLKTDEVEGNLSLENLLEKELPTGEVTLANGLALLADCNADADAKYIIGTHIADDKFGSTTAAEREFGIVNAIELITDDTNSMIKELAINYGDKDTTYTWKDGKTVAGKAGKIGKITDLATYNTEKGKYNDLVDLKQYFGNIPSADQTYVKDVYNDLLDVMKEELDTYSAGTNQIVKDYVNKLKNEDIIEGTNVADVVDSGADFDRANLDDLKDFLADIKADKNSTLKAVALYEDVEDESAVAEYIDALETMVSEIEEVNDALKSTSAVNKGLRDITGKLSSLITAINNYEDDTTSDTLYNKYQAAMAAFTQADLTKLTDYVEDVYEMFYTLNAVQRSNGKYVVRSEETEYARYLSEDDIADFDTNVKTLLTKLVDDSNDETYYQVLTETTSDITKYLKACTTDIEGISLGTTFTSSDAKKIVAARNAYAELEAVNFAGLTAKEKRAVKANEDLIEALYAKLIINGTITQTGWVDKGNGDWDYIAEDGSRPSKWIASGANWYYVKNGTMLRNSWIASDAQGTRWYYVDDNGVMVSNTTVNGYTFNSYGVWVK
ncbi:hypothetical protein DES51_1311 [Dielma fastidiosa]|uniref:Cell wall binding repeat protein n=1 Tax=Dielma fastidiosa TaxID=1034346 RepID=A0A318KI44_9FIRM|nr:hypothetical protein [Dielma fastidiosa]PXX73715.1 hypothetical protein DES51_1311 [Dielma fastidiosa]